MATYMRWINTPLLSLQDTRNVWNHCHNPFGHCTVQLGFTACSYGMPMCSANAIVRERKNTQTRTPGLKPVMVAKNPQTRTRT